MAKYIRLKRDSRSNMLAYHDSDRIIALGIERKRFHTREQAEKAAKRNGFVLSAHNVLLAR